VWFKEWSCAMQCAWGPEWKLNRGQIDRGAVRQRGS
jgi:hypothetical protein